MAVKRFAITVTGRVQGIGFRYFAKDAADSLGLIGWVRNSFDRFGGMRGSGRGIRRGTILLAAPGRTAAIAGQRFLHSRMPPRAGAGPEFEISF